MEAFVTSYSPKQPKIKEMGKLIILMVWEWDAFVKMVSFKYNVSPMNVPAGAGLKKLILSIK